MKTATGGTRKKRSVKKIILWTLAVLIVVLVGAGVYLYFNLNKVITSSLNKSFNSSIISDVYELKFERLSVNFMTGNISVHNVSMQPREKPLRIYPYINSSFRLKADKILLGDVQIAKLVKENVLKLEQIELAAPGIDFTIDDLNPVFFPFMDTAAVVDKNKANKKAVESFSLEEFHMRDATFHVANSAKRREFNIQQINILIQDVMIDQQPGKDLISYKHAEFSIGKLTGSLQRASLRHISFNNYKLAIDSLQVQHTYDTTIYRFANFSTGIRDVDVQTKDSNFHLSMKALDLSYKDKSIKLQGVSFKPNISETAIQAMHPFSVTQFSGSLGSMQLTGVNFDSMIFGRKVFIDQIVLDKVSAAIFKDNSAPTDVNKFPKYLGQAIRGIPVPLLIKHVKVTNVNLVNREKLPKGGYGVANIKRGIVELRNVTNLSGGEMVMKADAWLENKAHFTLSLRFNYQQPEFKFDGVIQSFNLPDINPLIQSYMPAKFNKGILDAMAFSGTAYHTNSSGTMKFLYHDLDLNVELKEKAGWKNAVLTFGANTALPSANPSGDKPARIVQFHVERKMNKSFINLVIKSLLTGLKETMIMSKENKQAYKEEKKIAKKEAKAEKKKARQERRAEKKKAKEESKKNKQ